MAKKELLVTAIENGTVIDHIPADKTYDVANLLRLQELDTPVTIGYNLPSKKIGRKGIIKITDKFFTEEEISRLSVVAPKIVLNIIRNYEVVEKKTVETPDELRGIVKCNNPKMADPPPSDLVADTKENLQNRLTRQRFGLTTDRTAIKAAPASGLR